LQTKYTNVLVHTLSVKLCCGKPPSPQRGSTDSKISGKLQKTTIEKEKNDQGSFYVYTFMKVDKKYEHKNSCSSNYWSDSRLVCRTTSYALV